MRALPFIVSLLLAGAAHAAPDSGLARTPPMGWSSWNQFGDRIDERLLLQTMDAMAANGLRDAGYVYINLDDGWQRHKGARRDHPLEPDPVKFPHGMRWLADQAHAYPPVLSGGEKQRAAIARAVIGKPELLLADEPTGNVDPALARRLLHLFVELNRLGTTVLIATHDMKLVQQAKAPVLHLEGGVMRAS